jgi:serine/threonine protein kinase
MYAQALKPGDVLGGKYRIARELGRGGMGVVYEAENVYTKRRVAIKCMHAHEAPDQGGQSRWLREAQAAARIQHRNVVDVYDVGFEQDAIFLVMELLAGETLAASLERAKLPLPYFLRLLTQAMRGVAHAHRVGIIHRDIKPENILLAREADQAYPVPKLLDFGIAKLDDLDAIGAGHALGTPLFMSLEQLRGQRDLDARVDVYGFGVILYMALTGRPPYFGHTLQELLYNVTTVQALPPEELRPELPRALCSVIARAIAKEREERIGSVQQLIEQLAPFCADESFGPNPGATTILGRQEHTTAPALDDVHTPEPRRTQISARVSATAMTTPSPARAKPEPRTLTVLLPMAAGVAIAAGALTLAFLPERQGAMPASEPAAPSGPQITAGARQLPRPLVDAALPVAATASPPRRDPQGDAGAAAIRGARARTSRP